VQHDAGVTAALRSFRNRKIDTRGGDQEESTSLLGIRIGRQPADVMEAVAAIHHVEHAMGTAVIDNYVNVDGLRRMLDNIADQLAEDEFGIGTIASGELAPFERFDEPSARNAGRMAVSHIESPTLYVPFSFTEIGPHDQYCDVVGRSPRNDVASYGIGGLKRTRERRRRFAQQSISGEQVVVGLSHAVRVGHDCIVLVDHGGIGVTKMAFA
jgi:hypothetical protein